MFLFLFIFLFCLYDWQIYSLGTIQLYSGDGQFWWWWGPKTTRMSLQEGRWVCVNEREHRNIHTNIPSGRQRGACWVLIRRTGGHTWGVKQLYGATIPAPFYGISLFPSSRYIKKSLTISHSQLHRFIAITWVHNIPSNKIFFYLYNISNSNTSNNSLALLLQGYWGKMPSEL